MYSKNLFDLYFFIEIITLLIIIAGFVETYNNFAEIFRNPIPKIVPWISINILYRVRIPSFYFILQKPLEIQ